MNNLLVAELNEMIHREASTSHIVVADTVHSSDRDIIPGDGHAGHLGGNPGERLFVQAVRDQD